MVRCGQKVNCPAGAREATLGCRPLRGGWGTREQGRAAPTCHCEPARTLARQSVLLGHVTTHPVGRGTPDAPQGKGPALRGGAGRGPMRTSAPTGGRGGNGPMRTEGELPRRGKRGHPGVSAPTFYLDATNPPVSGGICKTRNKEGKHSGRANAPPIRRSTREPREKQK